MSPKSHLELRFKHRIGMLILNISLRTDAPWTVLFGPSGSGKSTVLRVIAGLERPRAGWVTFDGHAFADSETSLWTPPSQRPMRWTAQKPVLYPFLTVEQNLALGIEEKGQSTPTLQQAIEAFHLEDLIAKRPHQLSGGEAQRLAVARAAIGARGKILLLDEPFTGLDARVRDQLIEDLRAWLGPTPIVSVTHDVAEAFHLDAYIVRIHAGHVIAQGPVTRILAEERAALLQVLG